MNDKDLTKEDIRWFQRFDELEQFKKRFGHTRVPANWKENVQLAHWVHSTRGRYKNMQSWRQTFLKDIGFEFKIRPNNKRPVPVLDKDPQAFEKVVHAIEIKAIQTTEDPRIFTIQDIQWYYMLLVLIQFKKDKGHTSVPVSHNDKSLAHWVMKQRKNNDKLPQPRIDALDAIKFIWRIYEVRRTPWEDRFSELIAYKKENGHVNVPQSNKTLGRWVWMQRRDQKTMPEKRKKMLESIGFLWDFASNETQQMRVEQKTIRIWDSHFEDLKQYKHRFGHVNVQPYWKENIPFARWVARQRTLHEGNKLSKIRFSKLEELGFVWDMMKVNRIGHANMRKERPNSTPLSLSE